MEAAQWNQLKDSLANLKENLDGINKSKLNSSQFNQYQEGLQQTLAEWKSSLRAEFQTFAAKIETLEKQADATTALLLRFICDQDAFLGGTRFGHWGRVQKQRYCTLVEPQAVRVIHGDAQPVSVPLNASEGLHRILSSN
jgi:hypothetical protein